jgi:UDP-N-acetylmuramoyl-L-alanine---L-glutamate ligase
MSVRFSELDGASIGVWGAGREIGSFAEQLSRRLPSARILVAAFDAEPPGDVRATLRAPAARIVTGAEIPVALADCEVVVRSPGVSIHRPELQALRRSGVPVTTATALWLAERGGARVIGVTGTKGKSTTAALALHLARATGATAHLAGNIGVPALDLLDREPADVIVLELSSFQIADLEVGPEVALITNVFREHTDWHGSEQAYRADKLRILSLPGVRAAVVDAHAQEPPRAEGQSRARESPSASQSPASGAILQVWRFGRADGWHVPDDGGIALRDRLVVPSCALPLPGAHNALNLCAALTALEAFGIVPPRLPEALSGFRALPHRLQTVAEHDGVLWVDDSISTTPESALAALASFPERDVVLIGGGQDRGQDYAQLARALAQAGAGVVGVPSTGSRLVAAALEAGVAHTRARKAADMGEAVALAGELAIPGTVILLSPAAPSYDHYRDFEERGERFTALAGRAREPAEAASSAARRRSPRRRHGSPP